MLDDELKEQMRAYLTRLRHPIRLTAWLDAGEGSANVRSLLTDIAAASELVEWVEAEAGDERVPSFGIHRPEEAPRVRFAGLPLGHELTSLVLALLHVGGHPPKESDETLEQVRGLTTALHFETYFSQSCQSCPEVVQAFNVMAALNPNISHTAIEGGLFPDEVESRKVMAVPTYYSNGEHFGQGRMELDELLEVIDSTVAQKRAAAIAEKDPFDVLIVGGGPAGAAAAIYAVRKGFRTGIVTENFGGQLLDTNAIENFISSVHTEGPQLAAALEQHVADYPVDVMKHQRVKRLVPGREHQVELESGVTLQASAVLIATGARWRNMNVPGEAEYRTRGVTYCPHCDGPLFKGKRVAVIGGGNSGVEAAIDLGGVVDHVTLLEITDHLKADDVLKRKLDSMGNIDVITQAKTLEILGDGEKANGLSYEDLTTGEQKRLDVAGIFVQIGLLPNTEWLEGVVELSPFKEIVVDDHGRTSVPGVFAAGDVTTVPYKQIIIATGDGAKAALGAFDYLIRRPPVETSQPSAPAQRAEA